MKREIIEKVERFMQSELMKALEYKDNTKRMIDYRIEHSYRVAYIAKEIAKKEGLNEELAFVGGLLHDVGYSIDMKGKEDYKNHGRYGAKIARPFLSSLGYNEKEVEEICFGIAIHVDDKADFDGTRTPLALIIGDADNIDRFDAFRLYEGLQIVDYMNLPLLEQKAYVEKMLNGLNRIRELPFGTKTSTEMWKEKIDFQITFYKKLQQQVEHSK